MSEYLTPETVHSILSKKGLNLIHPYPTKGGIQARYEIKCHCGNIYEITIKNAVYSDYHKGCGCNQRNGSIQRKTYNMNERGYRGLHKSVVTYIKHSAKTRDIEYNLSPSYMWNLFVKQKRKCAISGVDIDLPKNNCRGHTTASLDRIDSSNGYVIGNVQWVHKKINMMKQSYSQEEFIQFCRAVAENNK